VIPRNYVVATEMNPVLHVIVNTSSTQNFGLDLTTNKIVITEIYTTASVVGGIIYSFVKN